MHEAVLKSCLATLILAPLVVACLIAARSLLGQGRPARAVRRSMAVTMVGCVVACLVLFAEVYLGHAGRLSYGIWYQLGARADVPLFVVDELSASFALLTTVLVAIVGFFSVHYLEHDGGFQRYFVWYGVFTSALAVVTFAGTPAVLFFGWELLGFASVFLIGYFWDRKAPTDGALRALATYRFCDIFLLAGVLVWHHSLHGLAFPFWVNPPKRCRRARRCPGSSPVCSSPAWASRRSFLSAPGCLARWRAQRRRARYFTAPFRPMPAPIS